VHGEQDLLKALAVVLGVSAITSALSRWLKQPVVLGYIVAGLVIGPHVPVPLVANPEIVHTLSELGVTLLMFSLGLEFSLQKLLRVGKGVAFTALLQCSTLLWLGFVTGRFFGWSTPEAIFTGAIIAISSTTIIAKAFEEEGIKGRLRDFVVGILIVEDLVAVLLLAAFTAFASGTGLSALALAKTVGRLGVFLVGLLVVGMLVVPRAMRFVVKLERPEGTVVTSVGLCFATALLAREMGYSVALGAFIAGSLVAESGEAKSIAELVEPVRDVFAAIFFVSVGMMIDPVDVAHHWKAVVVLTVVVVVGKALMVALGAFLSGSGTRTSIRAGMSLAQIGEFSFIIASLGVTLKVTGAFLYTVAVAVSAVTTLLTPWLIRASDPFAKWVDSKLPHSLQTFAALYGSWLERLGSPSAKSKSARAVHRLVRLLVIDAAALAAIIVITALRRDSLVLWLVDKGLSAGLAWALVAGAAFTVALPFIVGILRVGTRLGQTVADAAFPHVTAKDVDLAAAPRRALIVTLQLALVLLIGTPLMAVT
jgi:monovalent cation:H+ antiporter-2, CPA2 family